MAGLDHAAEGPVPSPARSTAPSNLFTGAARLFDYWAIA